jgi:hypothetical protein
MAWRSMPFALCAALCFVSFLPAVPVAAERKRPFTVAETGRSFDRLAHAVGSIGGGRGTIRIAPGRYRDCAVQESGSIAFVAEQRGTAIFDGGICEDKATLVLRGRSARVEGLVFTRLFVDDGNGAGIRIEKGNLHVAWVRFADSQCGIISAIDPASEIVIEHSTFSGLGKHPDAHGVHSIYVGGYGGVRIVSSRFERGTSGHYLKSRAPRIEVLNSSFDDSAGRTTNYMIDLPNGAVGRIAGNSFIQGTDKENYSTMIAVGAEQAVHPIGGLTIENNQASLAPGVRRGTTFVGDWRGEPLVIRGNRLGPGVRLFVRR